MTVRLGAGGGGGDGGGPGGLVGASTRGRGGGEGRRGVAGGGGRRWRAGGGGEGALRKYFTRQTHTGAHFKPVVGVAHVVELDSRRLARLGGGQPPPAPAPPA